MIWLTMSNQTLAKTDHIPCTPSARLKKNTTVKRRGWSTCGENFQTHQPDIRKETGERTAGKNARKDAEKSSNAKGSLGTRRTVVTANTALSSLLIMERLFMLQLFPDLRNVKRIKLENSFDC